MQEAFNCAADKLEYILSRWWGFLAYVALTLGCFAWGWDGVDRFTYLANAMVVLLVLSCARRSDKAVHAKLDAIDPDASHNRLEERDEAEIERARSS